MSHGPWHSQLQVDRIDSTFLTPFLICLELVLPQAHAQAVLHQTSPVSNRISGFVMSSYGLHACSHFRRLKLDTNSSPSKLGLEEGIHIAAKRP